MKFIWLPVFLLVLLLSFSKFILFLQSFVLSFYCGSFKACFVCNVITFSVRHIRNSFGDVMKSRRSVVQYVQFHFPEVCSTISNGDFGLSECFGRRNSQPKIFLLV